MPVSQPSTTAQMPRRTFYNVGRVIARSTVGPTFVGPSIIRRARSFINVSPASLAGSWAIVLLALDESVARQKPGLF